MIEMNRLCPGELPEVAIENKIRKVMYKLIKDVRTENISRDARIETLDEHL